MAKKVEEMNLNEFCVKLSKYVEEFPTSDINKKANEMGGKLINFLNRHRHFIDQYPEISALVEGLGAYWVYNKNGKVSLYGLEALTIIADILQSRFKSCSGSVFHHVVTLMGNRTELIRNECHKYILKIVEIGAVHPNVVIDKLSPFLLSKNRDLVTEVQCTLKDVLEMQRTTKLSLSILTELLRTEVKNCLNYQLINDTHIILVILAEQLGQNRVLDELHTVKYVSGPMQKKINSICDEISGISGIKVDTPKKICDSSKASVSPSEAAASTSEAPSPSTTCQMALKLDIKPEEHTASCCKEKTNSILFLTNLLDPIINECVKLCSISSPLNDKLLPVVNEMKKSTLKMFSLIKTEPETPEVVKDSPTVLRMPPQKAKPGKKLTPPPTVVEKLDQSGAAADDSIEIPAITQKKMMRKKPKSVPASSSIGRIGSMRPKLAEGEKYALHSGTAGDVDEAWFLSAFEDVPNISWANHKELEDITKKLLVDLKSRPEHWEIKITALKKLRSVVLNARSFEEDILNFVKLASLELTTSLKDLRSQVVRETCLTLAYICKTFQNKVEAHTCGLLLSQLLVNMMSYAKVVVSSSYLALTFMLRNVNHSRLVNGLVHSLKNSRSGEVRTAACEFLELILMTWPSNRLEQVIPQLQDGIIRGMAENTVNGRMASRRAYWEFKDKFPKHAGALFHNLDANSRKALVRDKNPARQGNSTNMHPELSPLPQLGHTYDNNVGDLSAVEVRGGQDTSKPRRSSSSAIPLLRRASVTARASNNNHMELPSAPALSALSCERTGRPRKRSSGISQSQPERHYGPPSSRLGHHT